MNRRTFALGSAGALARLRARAPQSQGLSDAVRGEVFRPGDPGYRAAAQVYDTRWDGVRPIAIVRPRDARDVQAAVRWAGRRDVALVARSGGHAYNGASTSDGAVVVDLRHLSAVRPGTIAQVGPGAHNIEVYARLARHGLGWASGSCPTVGAGGLTLGGGMGLAARRHGLTLDTVTAIDVVTADGRLRQVRAGDGLFWALRGGGGNFGIVTRLHLRTFPVRHAARFFASFPASSAADALAAWDDLAPGAPAALTSICSLSGGSVSASGQFLGSQARLEQLVAPLREVPGASVSTVTAGWLDMQRHWAGCADGGLASCERSTRSSFAAASLYVSRKLTAAGRGALVTASRDATILLDAYGGAINDVAPGATAFVHRDARFSVQILSYGPIGAAAPAVARAYARVAPHGNGEAYQNYADPSLQHAQRAWYGANLPRLRAIKQAVDPDDRFHIRQGIAS